MEHRSIGPVIAFVATTLFVVVNIFARFQFAAPEQLIMDLQKAAARGDVEGFLSDLTEESRATVEKSYADRVVLRQAEDEFQKALDEKFGQGTEFLVPDADEDLRGALGRITATEVTSKRQAADGSVELRVRTTIKTVGEKTANIENTVAARKEGGQWKLSLGFPEKRLDTARIKSEIERITADVRNGRYEDRVAAMIALDNAFRTKEVK